MTINNDCERGLHLERMDEDCHAAYMAVNESLDVINEHLMTLQKESGTFSEGRYLVYASTVMGAIVKSITENILNNASTINTIDTNAVKITAALVEIIKDERETALKKHNSTIN